MGFLIRPAAPEDAEAIVAILNPIIEAGTYSAFDTPFTVEQERQYIAGLPPRALFHGALGEDRRVAGFQSMEPFATYTSAFDHVGVIGTYVAAASRRLGVARSLFEASFAAARVKGYEKVFTYVRSDNPAALATYRSQGFEVVGTARRHARIKARYVDEIIIERFL